MAVLNASVNMSAASKMEVHPRLLMEVSPELVELLDKLAAKSQTTRTEVLRKAIVLLDVSAQEKDRGRKIGIFDENGKLIQEIVGI
jgi:predicted transcriptional regulator